MSFPKFIQMKNGMKNVVKSLIEGLVLFFVLSACTAFRNVENLPPKFPKELRSGNIQSTQLEKLREGDILRILKNEGTFFYMKYDSFQADTLRGTLWKASKKKNQKSESLKVSLSEIEKLNVERVSVANTVGVLTTVALGLALAIVLIAYAANPIVLN